MARLRKITRSILRHAASQKSGSARYRKTVADNLRQGRKSHGHHYTRRSYANSVNYGPSWDVNR